MSGWRFVGLMLAILGAHLLMLVLIIAAMAGDPSGYWHREIEAGRAPPAEWWNGLASGLGLCCSFADGQRIDNVDWDTAADAQGAVHYRVRLEGKWIDVPDNAVVHSPNRYGPAVVWPYTIWMGGDKGLAIRCFLPGAGA